MPHAGKFQWPAGLRRFVRSAWFEPLVSVLVIVAIILSLYAYTDNWPPMVVVESDSMQHGMNDVVGVINTGDIVLVQKTTVPDDVTTYVMGEQNGYSTYGEYGDVLLYYKNGNSGPGSTPVIHRAMVWLTYTGTQGIPGSQGFEIPSLVGLSCPTQYELLSPGVSTPHCLSNSAPDAPQLGELRLFHVGYNNINVTIDLSTLATYEPWSGFITLGDNNDGTYDQTWEGGGCAISCIVQASWVVGVARGMIPWFGALKLWIDGNSGMVPSQSWDYLALSIIAIILLPQAVPWIIRRLRSDSVAHRTRPRGPAVEGTGGTSSPVAWDEVTRLTFVAEPAGYRLATVDYGVPQPRFFGGTRLELTADSPDLMVDALRDARTGGRPVPVGTALRDGASFAIEPPDHVEIVQERAGIVVQVGERPISRRNGARLPNGAPAGSR